MTVWLDGNIGPLPSARENARPVAESAILRNGSLREAGALAHKMLRETDKRAAPPGFLRFFGHNGSGCNDGRRKHWLRSCCRTTYDKGNRRRGAVSKGWGKTLAWGGFVCTAIACSLVLAGCGTATRAVGDKTVVAAEPAYRVGDRFTFDNPLVTWEVVAIEGDRVRWRSNGGDEQVTGFNPLMPVLEWASSRHGHGERIISDTQGALFPMRVGARLAFRASVDTDRPPYRWTFDWMCEVLKKTTADSAVGPVDAFKVACGRRQPNEMTFLYAPSIGHYVRMESTGADGEAPLVRRLVSFSRDTGTAVAGSSKADRLRTELGWAVDGPPARPSPQQSPTAVPLAGMVALTSIKENLGNGAGPGRPMWQRMEKAHA